MISPKVQMKMGHAQPRQTISLGIRHNPIAIVKQIGDLPLGLVGESRYWAWDDSSSGLSDSSSTNHWNLEACLLSMIDG